MENTEGSEGTPTKISDSGYSNSCGNSQSQRSGSSKSRHSGSNSSGSSVYGGKTSSSLINSNEATPQPLLKHKDLKKKKLKGALITTVNSPETNINTERSWNNSSNAERIGNDEDNVNTTSPQTNNVNSNSQQHKDELIKDCLTPVSIHSTQDTHNSLPGNEDNAIIAASSSIPSLKAGFPVPPTGDVISTPGSLGGKITDDEIVSCSPSKLTNETYFAIKQTTACAKNQITPFPIPTVGFSCVVSMRDGVILYTNTSVTTCLGYPKDMWLGRSFIDFVHPKDRSTFSTHITSRIAVPITKSAIINKEPDDSSILFCRIRRYRGLRGGPENTGYGVRERDVCYTPFRLDFSFRDMADSENNGMYLMISAMPIISPYLDWKGVSSVFTTRHTSSGTLSHIDPEAVAFIGYLPQDIIGRNIFDFYHSEDMLYLKQVYEMIVKLETPFKSSPYRLRIHNGDFITIETEWSTFINPWSRKLEFVVGHHRVVECPINTDVFQCMKNECNKMFSEDMVKLHRQCQDEILKTINEVLIKTSESEKHLISKRCKELAMFMDGLMKIPARFEDELRIEIPKEKSLSERDSVMLGEISPHHDYYDSKSSTETPPSYNQLNYSENLQRFFESHPWTSHRSNTPDVKSSNFVEQPQSSPDIILNENHKKYCSPTRLDLIESGDSGTSGESRRKFSYTRLLPRSKQANNYSLSKRHISPLYESAEYKPAHLTQELLNKHNSMMEKLLVKKHKEARSVSKAEEREKSERREKKFDYNLRAYMYPMNQIQPHIDAQGQEHGVKRPGSLTWETDGDCHKISKQAHLSQIPKNFHHPFHQIASQSFSIQQPSQVNKTINLNPNPGPNTFVPNNKIPHQHMNSTPVSASAPGPVNAWPPFSVTMTPLQQTQPTYTESMNQNNSNPYQGMYPAVYFIPTQQGHIPPQEPPRPPNSNGYLFQYMMYPSTMFGTQPIMYSHVAMAYPPMPITSNHLPLPNTAPAQIKPLGLPFDNYKQACQRTISKPIKTISQFASTVVVSGLGAGRSSMCIPSQATPADSQNASLKAEPGSRVGSHASMSLLNPRMRSIKNRNRSSNQSIRRHNDLRKDDIDGEGSSYSSFYSSILRTESSNSTENVDSGGETSPKIGNQKFCNTIKKFDPRGSRDNSSKLFNSSKGMIWEKISHPNDSSQSTDDPMYCKDEDSFKTQSTSISSDHKSSNCNMNRLSRPLRKLQPPWLDSVCVTSELVYRYQVDPRNMNDVLREDQYTLDTIDQPSLVNEQLSQLYVELQMDDLSTELKLESMTSSSEEETQDVIRKKKEYDKLAITFEEDAPLPSPIAH